MEQADYIINCEYVLLDAFTKEMEDASVVVKDGLILDILDSDKALLEYDTRKIIDRGNCLLIPGLINSHTHASMTLFRGIADDLPLDKWLAEHIFPMESRLTPELIEIGALLACAEMIKGGTTGFADMYFFEDVIADVVEGVGMRAWLGEGILNFPTPAFQSGFEALKETQRLMDKWRGHDRIKIIVAPHAPYTCSEELLSLARELVEKNNSLLLIHVSETKNEVEQSIKEKNMTPVEYLNQLRLMTDKTIAVHCVHLLGQDIEILQKNNVTVAHCPESNLKLGSGISPVIAMLQKEINIAIGTDGAASNNDLDMFSEMGMASKIQKGINHDPSLLSSRQCFSMATANAAMGLHEQLLGGLKKGANADFAIIDLDKPHLRPIYDPASHLVNVVKNCDVRDTVVGGRFLMEDYTLLTIDWEALLKKLKKITI
jgi:5-methylthioadenosine/S-adenosylhomocysteine deaminase